MNIFLLKSPISLDIEKNADYTDASNINKFVTLKNPFRYRSYYYDYETHLYYLNSRYYDPETGRFINADDVNILQQAKEFINGLNLYSYCNNNPINLTDESGAAWWDWLWKILVAVVIVAAVTAAIVFTAGAAAAALGASATIVSGVMTGAAIGGIVSGGLSIVGQCLNGIDNFDFGSIAIDSFTGAAFGAITAGTAGVGTIGAKVAGGIGKILLSGFSTLLHATNNGTQTEEAVNDILTSMFFTTLFQFITISGSQFLNNSNLNSSSSYIGNWIKDLFIKINNNTNLKIFLITGIAGVKDIFTHNI